MEVITIITSNEAVMSLFDSFIYSFPMLDLVGKDHDTAFFRNAQGAGDKLYYHFILANVEDQFRVNFNEAEVLRVKSFFAEKPIYMLDLQYAIEKTLTGLFKGFKSYLEQQDESLVSVILISHPFNGIKSLEYDY